MPYDLEPLGLLQSGLDPKSGCCAAEIFLKDIEIAESRQREFIAEEVCSPVAHRHVVLTIPKRLRVYTRFDSWL